MPSSTILVVEDDTAIRRGLADALKFAGYRVLEAADGQQGLDAALEGSIDLILLDILMPRLDGMGVLRELRKSRSGTPVIFLTAKGEEEDRVRGLRAGADDYVVKPFSATEVLARVEAVLRRAPERPAPIKGLMIAGRTVNFERREVTFTDNSRELLPELEANVLSYLAASPGRAVSREELLLRVWGVDPRGMQTRTVDMTIARLREHLRDSLDDPKVILTVRGKGYMLAQQPQAPSA
ncbi:MAG: response regulator transcription factor [Phycisphaerales bacterium]|nr:response regulator transcription factor [Phycisphaerales bacterium]